MKKAVLIDVVAQTITEVQVGHYSDIYKHIGNQCETFAVPVQFENGDSIFVDDEGLLKEVHGGFFMKDWNYPLCGNAVILGQDDEGESVDYKSDIEDIKKGVIFVSKAYAEAWQEKALNTPPQIISF
jgi:hypothetical protein